MPAHKAPRLDLCFVTETFPPEVGGAAMCAGRFAAALSARGHRVRVVRPRQGADAPGDPGGDVALVPALRVPLHPGLQFGRPCVRSLVAAWAADRPDLVHVVTEGPLGHSAVRAANRLRIPVTSTFHTNFNAYGAYYRRGGMGAPALAWLRAFHNRTALTLVPTAGVRRELEAAGFERLAVVGRGVDTTLFSPARRRDELRRCWNTGAGDVVAISVGRLAPEKNLGLAVRAFAAIRGVCPGARFVLVGDGPLRGLLQRTHPELLFAGMLRGEVLAEHYASADMFLFPSLTETFGNVALEAMASGLAMVAFDNAAAEQHVRPGWNGLLAPRGDAAAFVSLALGLAQRPERIAALRTKARRTALSLGWDAIGEALEAELWPVVRGARAASGHPEAALRERRDRRSLKAGSAAAPR